MVTGGCPTINPVERDNFAVGESQRPDVDPREASAPWLDSLFELSPDLLCLAALDGYFRLVNPAVLRSTSSDRPGSEIFSPALTTRSVAPVGSAVSIAPVHCRA